MISLLIMIIFMQRNACLGQQNSVCDMAKQTQEGAPHKGTQTFTEQQRQNVKEPSIIWLTGAVSNNNGKETIWGNLTI